MNDDVPVYDHPVLSAHARRVLTVLAAVAALVLAPITPAQAANGHVTGTVTADGGGPLADVWVDLYTADELDYVDGDVTDAQGGYDVSVPPGTYLVVFWPDAENYLPELYDDVQDFDIDDATPVVVTDGGSVQAHAALARTASISGHVTMHEGDPVNAVRVYDANDEIAGFGRVDQDGSYHVPGLAPGDYRVAFNRLSGFAFSAPEFYDDHEEASGLAGGDVVTLGEGETRTGVDAVLAEGGHLTGTLRDADGNPLRCRLQAFTSDRSLITRNGWSDEATGEFDITGLSTGAYRVRVVDAADCRNGLQYVDADRGALATDDGAAVAVGTTVGAQTQVADAPLVYDLGPTPTNVVLPSITGTPTLGSRLTASRGSWIPSTHLRYAYQWLASGAPIVGETGSSYRPRATEVGHPISVRVTVHRGARSASATSAATAPVGLPTPPPLKNMLAPRVVASPVVGVNALLTAAPGMWLAPTATYTYVWASGSRVWQSGPSARFRPPDQSYGLPLSLTVVAVAPGYSPGSVTIPVTEKVGLGDWWSGIRAPKLRGVPEVGERLTVRATKVSPKPSKVTYTWYREGKRIKGVKRKHYTLTAKDVGHKIHVLVSYRRQNYRPHGVWTQLLGPVQR